MVKNFLRKARSFLVSPVLRSLQSREIQVLLSLKYKEVLRGGAPLPSFDEIGFSVFSQSDEDGILLYIFSLIGVTNKKVVDIGCGGLKGSNTANLIINHGWIGLLIDGSERAVEALQGFYSECFNTQVFPPTLVHAFVTVENINTIVSEHGFAGKVDLLSIDIDGVDYWIWKALDCISPRVVVVEYQDIIGPDQALTVPYRPDFKFRDYEINVPQSRDYAGASLLAFVKLARQKGYRLVGCNRYGFNAFFVRAGLGEECLLEVPIESCFEHPRNKYRMGKDFQGVREMDWVEV